MNIEINQILELIKKRKLIQAETKISKLIKKIKPNHEVINIFAMILFQQNKIDQAILQWEKAIEINPNYFFGYNNLGNAFYKKEKYETSIQYYTKAINLNNDYVEAYNNRANAFLKLHNVEEAIENYKLATKLNSNYLPSIKSMADIYVKLKENDKAIVQINKIISLEPDNADMYSKKGDILNVRESLELAIQAYEMAYKLDPSKPFLLGNLIFAKNKTCDWEHYDKNLRLIEEEIINKKKISSPFIATTLFDSPKLHFEAAEIWQNEYKSIFKDELEDIKKIKLESSKYKKNSDKIKLGFFSADFRHHAMGFLMVRMLELHDKSKFELHGFHFGSKLDEEKDLTHKRIKNCFDSFTDINFMSDKEAAEFAREKQIDIAIDLMCYTGDANRFGVFVHRAAPIQVNFLGYPGTSGSNSIDYIVADKTLILEEYKKFFSEKIIYLPDTYQPNEETKEISNKNLKKKDLNLSEEMFIFCCFNGHQKITPKFFGIWMEILREAENSLLWLLKDNDYSEKNLKEFAKKEKVDPNRIIFAKRLPLDQHFERLKFADLFIDSFPYNAHTTCSDALRMNVPVVTLKGDSFPSRVAASLLKTLNMDELITDSLEQYKKLILKIYDDKNYLLSLKNKIERNKEKSNLYKTDIFTKNIEKAYLKIYDNYLKGNSPKDFEL